MRWKDRTSGNQSYAIEGNYCRNPFSEKSAPWCYIKKYQKEFEICDIPKCWIHIVHVYTTTTFKLSCCSDEQITCYPFANQNKVMWCFQSFLQIQSYLFNTNYGYMSWYSNSLSLTHKTHGNYAPCFIFQKVVPWYLHVTDAT